MNRRSFFALVANLTGGVALAKHLPATSTPASLPSTPVSYKPLTFGLGIKMTPEMLDLHDAMAKQAAAMMDRQAARAIAFAEGRPDPFPEDGSAFEDDDPWDDDEGDY